MILRFLTRRFFCNIADCRRHIFAEQLPELALRRARGTPRLDETLIAVGMECGGEPGRRLCDDLGIVASGDTILRRLRDMPAADSNTETLIGVDDFAFRRGQRYGTILVDHESGGVIDLLADRTSASLENWIAARPVTPTIVTRDRSGVYAKAITTAAPDAVQVADRWHLLANCREALVRVLDRHHPAITEAMAMVSTNVAALHAAKEVSLPLENPPPVTEPSVVTPPAPAAVLPALTLSRGQQYSIDRRDKRVARYKQVLELHRQGHSQRSIQKQLKMSRQQIMKLLNADGFPERAKTHYLKQVDRYMDDLRARWAEGERNARVLTRYLRTLGYTGGHDRVRRCVASWRTPIARLRLVGSKPRHQAKIALKLQRPSSDRLSWLMVKDDIERRAGESELLDELRKTCAPVGMASELARSFGAAVRARDLNAATVWTERARQATSPRDMNGFAEGLIRNWPEVKAAIELPYSNGRTEGHVNRLKLIKRKMYGRAKLDLLRIRIVGSGPTIREKPE